MDTLKLPCASRQSTDFLEVHDHGDSDGIVSFTVRDTVRAHPGSMTVVLTLDHVDELLDYLLTSRAGPLGKLAAEASIAARKVKP